MEDERLLLPIPASIILHGTQNLGSSIAFESLIGVRERGEVCKLRSLSTAIISEASRACEPVVASVENKGSVHDKNPS